MRRFSTLCQGFLASVARAPEDIALEIKDNQWSYHELALESQSLAQHLLGHLQGEVYLGIFSGRSIHAYLGILATLFNGKAYLPIDLKASDERLIEVLGSSACRVFVVDEEGLEKLAQIEARLEPSTFVCSASCATQMNVADKHEVLVFDRENCELLDSEFGQDLDESDQDGIAYVLFTSGSTGKPKGVPISHKNICAYLSDMSDEYPVDPTDRCTQAFEFTFDPSVHDMFMTWLSGACLCVMSEAERLGAQYFIKKKRITIWNTLPSIVKMCLQTRSFNEKYLSTLRYTFFNGEPLGQAVVSSLQERAPDCLLVNMYGLTETTVNLFHYAWQGAESDGACRNGIVAIGKAFGSVEVFLSPDEVQSSGLELCLGGDQVFAGYLEFSDVERAKNRSLFFDHESSNGDQKVFMKTGDLVEYDESLNIYRIVGRNDEQIKLRGHRIDLNALRFELERASDCLDALVLKSEGGVGEGEPQLIGFLKGESFDLKNINDQLQKTLPQHAQLSRVIVLNEYPYLVSGKVNKKALLAMV